MSLVTNRESYYVRINLGRCRRIAELLSNVALPRPDEDSPLDSVRLADLPTFYLAVVAICHQTSPFGRRRLEGRTNDGRHLFGWDYLRCRWADRVSENPDLNRPDVWRMLHGSDIENLLRDAIGDSTISDPIGRASLLQDLGQCLIARNVTNARELFDQSDGYLVSPTPAGLFSCLGEFRAYGDPIKKKSCFFLELMRSQCGWRYRDPENLGPPVDYHEIRGHLRIGTVEIIDTALEVKVRTGVEVSAAEDKAIRGAVYEAICEVSRSLGTADPATLHYLFWNFFRRCCGRENPHCNGCSSSCGLPVRYRAALMPLGDNACAFRVICPSANRDDMFVEHLHTTEYY